jgi:hypothetical protein
MQFGTTLMGKEFRYEGSLATGLKVHFDTSAMWIKPETIQVVREQIDRRSPVLMGANRSPLVRNSVGETLYQEYGVSPQVMSYILPLLVDEGFCSVSRRRPYEIRRIR